MYLSTFRFPLIRNDQHSAEHTDVREQHVDVLASVISLTYADDRLWKYTYKKQQATMLHMGFLRTPSTRSGLGLGFVGKVIFEYLAKKVLEISITRILMSSTLHSVI